MAESADTPPCRYPIHSSNVSHSLDSGPTTMLYSSSPCPNYNQQAALWLDGKALTGIQFVTVTGVGDGGVVV